MELLLDTNAYSAFMSGRDEVVDCIRRAERVFLSTIVIGELLFGFRNGNQFDKNYRMLEAFLDNHFVELVPATLTTADRFGRIAAALRAKGRPLPSNDIWIAAHALETGADLLSYDNRFREIDGLPWIHLTI